MTRRVRTWAIASLVVLAGCSGSTTPTAPQGPRPVTVSGTLSSLQTAQPVAGVVATSSFGMAPATSDTAGAYRITGPIGIWDLLFRGDGFVERRTSLNIVNPTVGLNVNLIALAPPFSLDYYRQLVRGLGDNAVAQPLARWTQPPKFHFLTTIIDTGDRIPTEILDVMEAMARALTPKLTGGRFAAAEFARSSERPANSAGWIVIESYANGIPDAPGAGGDSLVGVNPGRIRLRYRPEATQTCGYRMAGAFYHEIVHALGYWHTSEGFSVDNGCTALLPNLEYHAVIAYSRPVGNRDPDTDVSYVIPTSLSVVR